MDSEKGQSLVEVTIAATVGIMVVSALTFATIFSLRNANFAKTSSQATKLAQEGIERVRTGRDRNQAINNNGALGNVTSWNGDSRGTGAVWDYQINGNCTTYCYFNVDTAGSLQFLNAAASIPSAAETIGQFRRVVILSDNSSSVTLPDGTSVPSYQIQKTVTALVTWTDFAGSHESRLVTILRRL